MPKAVIIFASILGIAFSGPVMAQNTAAPPLSMPGTPAESAREATTTTPLFIPEQASDQVLANSIIGANVVDIAGNKVGTVKDLILDKRGNAVGIVVSWGGVLGIGEKSVGISLGPAQLLDGEQEDTKLVRLNVTRDAIEAAPEFMDAADREAEAARANRSSGTGQ